MEPKATAWETLHPSRLAGPGPHLDRLCIHLDLAPRDSFVRPSTRVRAIKLLGRVDVDSIVSPIPLGGGAESANHRRQTHTYIQRQSTAAREAEPCVLDKGGPLGGPSINAGQLGVGELLVK